MRRVLGVLFVTAMAWSATAQEAALVRIERPAGAPATIGEFIAQRRGAVRANVISVDSYEDAFLIPIAGSAAGAGNTFFKSDMAFDNGRSVAQVIGVGWLAQGVDNTHAGLAYFSLSANTTTTSDDFVATALGRSGLGAILVFAMDASHVNDSAGQLNGFSRIWTKQPGSNGTVSQSFPAVSALDSIGSLVATIIGLKQSAQYRSNVGIVNLDTVQHTWTLRSSATGTTFTVTVPALSVVQAAVPANSSTAAGNLALTMKSDGFGFWWSAYGSSTDNTTGDGWVSRAIQ